MRAPSRYALLAAAAMLMCAARGAPALDAARFAYQERPGAALPLNSSFLDSDGRRIRLGELTGGAPLILVPAYLHCSNLCGVVRSSLLTALRRAQLAAGRDYVLAVLSIDPAETPADARAAKADDVAAFAPPGTGRYWHYLTGVSSDIRALTAAVGFRDQFDPRSRQFIHPAGVVFATAGGTISSYLLGVGYRPADVRSALERAHAGRLAAAAAPLLLICFHFDPATGRYSLAILKVLRLGAVLTLLSIGALVLIVRRKHEPP